MRALRIALLALGPLLGACKSAPVQTVAPESPAERFDRIERRWAAIEKLQFPDPGEPGSRPPPDPKAHDAELESLFREMTALAPTVPGAIEFCVEAGRSSPHSDFFAFRTRSLEALQALLREHPDNELTTHFLWRLWSGSSWSEEKRDDLLVCISKLDPAPSGSPASGWRRLAAIVSVNGIGGPAPWNHDARLARRQLAEVQEDYRGSVIAVHARELARGLEIAAEPSTMPTLDLVDFQGVPVDLAQERGRPVVILFWDPRVDDVRLLLAPAFERRQGLPRVIAVDMGGEYRTAAELPSYMASTTFATFADPRPSSFSFAGLSKLPASLILDGEGRLCAANLFGRALRVRLEQPDDASP